jgi:uncharacterized protein DUF4231
MSHTPLVNETELQAFIEHLPRLDESHKLFLKTRWLHQLCWWDNRSREARTKYFRYRAAVIVGGVAIPVISGLPDAWNLGNVPKVIVALLGAIVAGCSAWEGVANYGEVWREKRRAAELLKVEGWKFFQLAAEEYRGKTLQAAYSQFAARVEQLIAKEIGEYLDAFEPTKETAKPGDGSSTSGGPVAT